MSVLLAVDDLPPAPSGTFYEVWLVGPGGVSAGSFHQRGSQDSVALWLGVEPEGYDAFHVTRQPVAGGTNAPGVVVLRGPRRRGQPAGSAPGAPTGLQRAAAPRPEVRHEPVPKTSSGNT